MRFLLLVAFVCLISLNNCQETSGNPITRFFGSLFGKNSNKKENVEIKDPLLKEDFDNQLPRHSTDKLINDAIEQRFLEEGRAQESVGSPFIQAAASEEDSSSVPFDDKLSRTRKNTATNKMPITEALRIVNSSTSLKDCVARVICELSCNATQYGTEGRKVFSNLIKIQFDKNFEKQDSQYFRKAAIKGRQILQSKQPCSNCRNIYPTCKANSQDLVTVASMFNL